MDTPSFLYGTAWKEERSEELTAQAIELGFRGIDTANQRVHYNEKGVGLAVKKVLDDGMKRSELFLQTKFTYAAYQDKRLPFDPSVSLDEQVRQSVKSSLSHLHTDYLDSYLIHGPEDEKALTKGDLLVWRTMEELCEEGVLKSIGVSNFSAAHLLALLEGAKIKPAFVQNRCYASAGWDLDARRVCNESGVVYQAFNLLRDSKIIEGPVSEIAKKYGKTFQQIVYRWAIQAGMLPISGTSSVQHGKEALSVFDFELDTGECELIENIR